MQSTKSQSFAKFVKSQPPLLLRLSAPPLHHRRRRVSALAVAHDHDHDHDQQLAHSSQLTTTSNQPASPQPQRARPSPTPHSRSPLQSSDSRSSRRSAMAATPALPGPLCCISALILLIFATVSAPIWNDISFLDVTTNGQTTHFGVFGYTGSPRQLGYYIDSAVLGPAYVFTYSYLPSRQGPDPEAMVQQRRVVYTGPTQ